VGDLKISPFNIGERPCFFADPAIDQLLGMLLAMSTELAVTRDRLDSVERLLEGKSLVRQGEIEDYRPDAEVAAERQRQHQEYLQRILRIVREERQRLTPFDQMTAYRRLVDEFQQL
jgi:hypothetical protein